MPSINLDFEYPTHPKTKRLVGLLGKNAEMLPIRLWIYCGKFHAETGVLTGYSPEEIESQVDWWGRPGAMIEAMVKVGFLDVIEGGWAIHDWLEHAGHIQAGRVRAKKAADSRWRRLRGDNKHDAPSMLQACSKQSHEQSSYYAMQCNTKQEEKTISTIESGVPNTKEEDPPPEFLHAAEKYKWSADAEECRWYWLSILRRPPGNPDTFCGQNFDEWMAKGVAKEAIIAAIKDPNRRRTEPIWDLEKRLFPRGTGPPNGESKMEAARKLSRKLILGEE